MIKNLKNENKALKTAIKEIKKQSKHRIFILNAWIKRNNKLMKEI